MSPEVNSFVMGAEEMPTRRRKQLSLRATGGAGLLYGVSAFGYPLGAIPGVQVPATEPPLQGDQFGGGAGAGEGSGDAGGAGGGDGGGSV